MAVKEHLCVAVQTGAHSASLVACSLGSKIMTSCCVARGIVKNRTNRDAKLWNVHLLKFSEGKSFIIPKNGFN